MMISRMKTKPSWKGKHPISSNSRGQRLNLMVKETYKAFIITKLKSDQPNRG